MTGSVSWATQQLSSNCFDSSRSIDAKEFNRLLPPAEFVFNEDAAIEEGMRILRMVFELPGRAKELFKIYLHPHIVDFNRARLSRVRWQSILRDLTFDGKVTAAMPDDEQLSILRTEIFVARDRDIHCSLMGKFRECADCIWPSNWDELLQSYIDQVREEGDIIDTSTGRISAKPLESLRDILLSRMLDLMNECCQNLRRSESFLVASQVHPQGRTAVEEDFYEGFCNWIFPSRIDEMQKSVVERAETFRQVLERVPLFLVCQKTSIS